MDHDTVSPIQFRAWLELVKYYDSTARRKEMKRKGSEIFEGLSQSHVAQTLCLFESGDLEYSHNARSLPSSSLSTVQNNLRLW